MEEWVGLQWHRFATRRAQGAPSSHAVTLAEMQRAVALLLHAGGARQRIAAAQPLRVGGPRTVWQRVAGSGTRVALPQWDADVLALPERLDVFGDVQAHRDLYLWWAALAACFDPTQPWAEANRAATAAALGRFPGLHARWQRLHEAELARRPPATDALEEATLQRVLRDEPVDGAQATTVLHHSAVAPVWTWLVPCADSHTPHRDGTTPVGGERRAATTALPQRRRARRSETPTARAPLLLAAKGESLKTFADPMAIDRAHDDDDDGSAAVAAEELEQLTLQRSQGSLAARVRFDLDLPSASADDLPLGPGEPLPEWDLRAQRLVDARVSAQWLQARDAPAWLAPPALHALAARVRRRLEVQRAAPRWQRGSADGSEIDLDAWVRERGLQGGATRDAVYLRRVRAQRELATLLLADLSLSTDAHANDRQRVIDVIREALYVFGDALSASGDAFSMVGFSSLKRTLRLHAIKGFDERWGASVHARLGALKPGYYTRMGAALRAATRRLAERPERQRLLLLLTDGKPHDLDGYEGRLGMEDTREAVHEARRAGLLPFALSIDCEAGAVMPRLFGHGGWAWVRRPEELPQRLAALYARLTR
jgi:nitric oxide reductase NorD protein